MIPFLFRYFFGHQWPVNLHESGEGAQVSMPLPITISGIVFKPPKGFEQLDISFRILRFPLFFPLICSRKPENLKALVWSEQFILKLPVASYRESSTVRNADFFWIRSLTPQQATGNALAFAVQTDLRVLFFTPVFKRRGNTVASCFSFCLY